MDDEFRYGIGTDSGSESNDEVREPTESVRDGICRIKHEHGLSRRAVGAIAALFREHGHDVPKDARTILETPRKPVDDKTFIHLGLKQGLERILTHYGAPNDSDTIYLNLNIDGVPLSDSSSVQLWPILCIVSNVKRHPPFVISRYCGPGKPPSLELYVPPFIDEYVTVRNNGFTFRSATYHICIKIVLCDALARAFIKGIKAHNGISGCERCIQRGEKVNGIWTFQDFDAPIRTDEKFRRGV